MEDTEQKLVFWCGDFYGFAKLKEAKGVRDCDNFCDNGYGKSGVGKEGLLTGARCKPLKNKSECPEMSADVWWFFRVHNP